MNDNGLPYKRSLDALESLLAGVKRPGDFCVHGALALPMPMIEVDGPGLLSFPLAQAQIAALIAAAERAPYGRRVAHPPRQPRGAHRSVGDRLLRAGLCRLLCRLRA